MHKFKYVVLVETYDDPIFDCVLVVRLRTKWMLRAILYCCYCRILGKYFSLNTEGRML